MTGPSNTRRSPTKAAARRTRTARAKAPTADLEARIAYLEERLMSLDVRRPSMESTRTWFAEIVPPEASRHFMTAGREQLLGLRALVDHWIGRLDPEKRTQPRETIPIE